MTKGGQLGRWGGVVVAGIAAAEVIIMSSPFAGFFYASLGFRPLLGFLSDYPATAWLNGFFLPNAVVTNSALLEWHREIGLLLVGLGLWGFVISAFQVYGNKLLKRGVATGLLYRVSRHPQYLSLAVAGYGLLAIWPRFLLLLLWVTMLFLYAALARFEEGRMRERFGADYIEFSESRAYFLPGSPVRRLFEATFGRLRPGWLGWAAAYATCLLLAVGAAFALRAYTVSSLNTHPIPEHNMVVLPAWPEDDEVTAARVSAALEHELVREMVGRVGKRPLVARIFPMDYLQTAVAYLAGSDRFQRLEGLTASNLLLIARVFILPTQGYRWGSTPLLGSPPGPDGQVKVVFSVAIKPYQRKMTLDDVLDVGVRLQPLVVAEIDTATRSVIRAYRVREPWGRKVVMPKF